MLDFSLPRDGPIPDVRRALIVYWTVERERETYGFRGAVRRQMHRPPIRSRGSVGYQHRKGGTYDAELRAAWGAIYPALRYETLRQSRSA